MSTREPLKSGDVVTTTTTTTTTIEKKPDLALCELWTSLVLGILVTIGAIASFNWVMVGVGLLSAVGSGILIFVQNNNGVRRIGFWILFSALIIEAIAFLALLIIGIALMVNPSFLGFGFFFGIILLATSVPVLIMVILDATAILRIRPQIFERAKITITEQVTTTMEEGKSPSETKPAKESDEVSASRSQKLPLLAIRK